MKKIVWKGFFDGSTGYINATKAYPLAIKKAGLECEIEPLRKLKEDHPLYSMVAKDKENAVTILHQIPTVSPNEQGYFTVTEFDVCEPRWWRSLVSSEIVITQSQFCKDVFAKIPGMDKEKIHIANYILDSSLSHLGSSLKKRLMYNNTSLEVADFIFGSIFEWVARKKPEIAWIAFMKEFPYKQYPNVLFLNKMTIPNGYPYGMRDWKHRIPKDPRIITLMEHVEDIGALYRTFDCYVSCTAGEGWGATLSEAMACGVPTIASNHSGNLEFMNENNSYLVDTTDWNYIGNDPTNRLPMVFPWQRWKLPKVESIQKAMREVYEIKMDGKKNPKVREALQIKQKLTMKNVGKQLKKALETIL